MNSEQNHSDIEAAFKGYIEATAAMEWQKAISFFTDDAQGFHSILGHFAKDKNGLLAFMEKAPSDWELELIWHISGCGQVLYKWRHILPGKRPNGELREFFGYCELNYDESGKFNQLKSYPDWHQMNVLKEEGS